MKSSTLLIELVFSQKYKTKPTYIIFCGWTGALWEFRRTRQNDKLWVKEDNYELTDCVNLIYDIKFCVGEGGGRK